MLNDSAGHFLEGEMAVVLRQNSAEGKHMHRVFTLGFCVCAIEESFPSARPI